MKDSEKLVKDIEDATKEIEQRMEENPKLDIWDLAISLWIRASDEKDMTKDLRTALEPFIDDEECSFDHHGNCQTHGVTNPCQMQIARAAIERCK